MKATFFYFFFYFFLSTISAQKTVYSALAIPLAMQENANAVVRLDQRDINISSQRNLNIKSQRVVTVLNELGTSDINALAYYDLNTKVKKIEATVFDAFGKEIKAFKRSQFKDTSVGDGFSIFNDSRMLYLDYTPINFPFTIVFDCEIETSNTAFIPSWSPSDGYFVSTEKAILNVNCVADLGFKYKEVNFTPNYNIQKSEKDGKLSYEADNIHAIKREDSSPEFSKMAPIAYMKVEKFNLEGVDGVAKTWEEFGKWYYDALLVGTDELPLVTQNKIKELVGNEKNPLAIAKIVYQYVQDKTRYVSIQVGIGGFKPMLAKDVDKLGYGDCKALSNYTRALLGVVGVPSYYTIVYSGSRNRKDIQQDFVSVQGDHIILAIPNEGELVWLECTNQTMPFGFQGTFTDDRAVLLVKPEGGQIVKTKSFLEKDNSQISNGNYTIAADGGIKANIVIVTKGSQYDENFSNERFSAQEKEAYYKSYFENINNLKLDNIVFKNDRDHIEFTQEIALSAAAYASLTANKLLFAVNVFNANSYTPKRYRNRENAFEVNRGFYDYDEISIYLPTGFDIEALPQDIEIKSKFGEYQMQIIKKPNNTLTYKRTLYIKNGQYDKKEYDEYRLFREQISRSDNAKMILTKKP